MAREDHPGVKTVRSNSSRVGSGLEEFLNFGPGADRCPMEGNGLSIRRCRGARRISEGFRPRGVEGTSGPA